MHCYTCLDLEDFMTTPFLRRLISLKHINPDSIHNFSQLSDAVGLVGQDIISLFPEGLFAVKNNTLSFRFNTDEGLPRDITLILMGDLLIIQVSTFGKGKIHVNLPKNHTLLEYKNVEMEKSQEYDNSMDFPEKDVFSVIATDENSSYMPVVKSRDKECMKDFLAILVEIVEILLMMYKQNQLNGENIKRIKTL